MPRGRSAASTPVERGVEARRKYLDRVRKPAAKPAPAEENPKTLKGYVAKEIRPLYTLRTAFPFDFFPTTIVIEPNIIHIKDKLDFFSTDVRSIPIKELIIAEVESGLLFATLKLTNPIFQTAPPVEYLWKEQAFKARRIIQGLITVHREGLDISNMSTAEIIGYLERIGSAEVTYAT